MDIMKWLKGTPPLKPLYYVTGEESFLIDEIRNRFLKRVFPEEGTVDFNRDDVDASKGTAALREAAETLPVMARQRLVFCHSAQKFQEKDWEALKHLVENPIPSTVLVLFFDKMDRRKKHFKSLTKHGEELKAESPREWETGPWLDFMADRESLKFPPSAKQLFQQLVGSHLPEIKNEMRKLKSYMGERHLVEDRDIPAVISRVKADSIFSLTDAICRKDRVRSLDLLARLLENNENSIGILILVARHIRILSRIRDGQRKGWKRNRLISATGVPPYFMNNYLSQAKIWTESQITQTMTVLYETEKALKSSPLSAHIWLENFILQTCR